MSKEVPEGEAAAVDRLLGNRAILESLPGRVLLVSPEDRILYVNRTMPGRSTADFVGTSVANHIADEDRAAYREAFELAWSAGKPIVTELRTRAGTCWEARLARVNENEESGRAFMLITSIDVTPRKEVERTIADKKRLEEQLVQAQKMEAIGQLTAGIAHNFNNLLAIILPNAQLCRSDPGREGDQRLADIEHAGRRASEMIRQLMLFAGHASEGAMVPLDLVAVASRVAETCRSTFDRRIAVVVEAPAPVPHALGREAQIEQALLNLCSNARDALEGAVQPPRITVAVDVAAAGAVRVRVIDNGPGMTEATRLRVFEPFFTTKGIGRGTGLGLASVYAIVKQHGGKIRCESRPGAGATFEIELPATGAPPMESGTSSAPERAPVTVLVIDDEPLLRRVVRVVLELEGYRVLEAADGPEGVFVFERQRAKVGVVILDRSMPGMSGEEIDARLAEIDPNVPVILLSGMPDQSWRGRRPAEILSKPADAGSLVDAVRRLVPLPPPPGARKVER
jgi:PAS domain S-box-containing protein